MCKKFISFISIVLVLGMVSNSYGVVVGDWEYNFDGWQISGNPNVWLSHDSYGATLNSSSLRMNQTQSGWGINAIHLSLTNEGLVSDFFANDKFSIDVSWKASEWIQGPAWPGWGAFAIAFIVNAEGPGWQAVGDGPWIDPSAGDGTTTLTFDYSATKGGIPANPTYLELFIQTSWVNYLVGGIYYLDNAQLTPEPTTIALLGLGSLALLRRKRG